MRRFLVLGHTQATAPPLPLNDPAGAGGRWDLLARCVTSALLVSHGCRRDTEIVLVLAAGDPPRSLRVDGRDIQRLNPDERSTVALLSRALEAVDVGAHETQRVPGLHSSRRGLEEWLRVSAKEGPVWHLVETGETPVASLQSPGETATFVLSDHHDPTSAELEQIRAASAGTLRLGPTSLHADQCITVVHHYLDRVPAPDPLSRHAVGTRQEAPRWNLP